MAQKWYIDANGQVEGPLTDSELRVRAADGLLQPLDSVSVDGVKWVAAKSVPELAFPPATNSRTEPQPKPAAKPRQPLLETVVSGSSNVLDSSGINPPPFSPLDSIPGYDLQGTLGIGACGVVFRAVQKKLNRVVALKTVKMAQNTPPDVLARFEQEAVSLARLHHPNIVSVYDCGHSHGRAFFAMELLDGEDLDARLDRAGPLDEHTAWLIARQTAAALDHAAKLGVIHRDIKPANLFLVPPPTGFPLPVGVPMVKVTDFGLALTRSGAEQTEQKQTAAGVILGTPVYMAPEQFAGSDVDPRADIYSLGATVYHILSGQVPFDGRTVWDVMMKKAGPAPRLQPPISKESIELVAAMLATSADDRPADYAALIARIDALPCLEGAFSSARLPVVSTLSRLPTPAPSPPPKRKRWVYAVAVFALLGLAVGVAALAGAFNRPQGQTDPNAKPATYVRGQNKDLFSNSVLGWSGPGLEIEKDEEKPVLTGKGTVTRKLSAFPNIGVVLGIALHQATAVDVVIATTDGAPTSATRWIVRLDPKTGAAFGKCVGSGAFEPLGEVIPVQFVKENQTPYLELRYERAGGVLSAWFDNKLLGRTPDAGLRTTELRIEIKGGPIRIESATEVELIEVK